MTRVPRPEITLKIAQTLDGRVATSRGDSRWITGHESRRRGHALRAAHDAIIVGAGTVAADDPELTVRLVAGPDPLRVILDSRLRTPLTARVFGRDPHRTLFATTDAAPAGLLAQVRGTGAGVVPFPPAGGRVPLDGLVRELKVRGIRSALVEGGPEVIGSFLRARLADRMVVFVAPKIVGTGRAAIGDLGIEWLNAAIVLSDTTCERSGSDWVVTGRPIWSEPHPRDETTRAGG